MKWYYEWRLNMVRARICALEKESRVKLPDDYTVHSKLRVLNRLAGGLQRRLDKRSPPAAPKESKEPC
jgi:hypothetical protein